VKPSARAIIGSVRTAKRYERVRKLSRRVFEVPSRTPGHNSHLVRVHDDGTLTCDCTAGINGHKCHAQEAVAARLLRNPFELKKAVGL